MAFGAALVLGSVACSAADEARPDAEAEEDPSTGVDEADADPTDVLASFEAYREAILAGDATAAVSRVARSAGPYYDEIRGHALHSDEATVRGLPLVDQVNVVMMRLGVEVELLRTASGMDLVAAAIERGLVGESGVRSTEIENVDIHGTTAYADVVGTGGSVQATFRYEEGAWKLDLVELTVATAPAFEAVAEQQGLTREQFLDSVIIARFGTAGLASAWVPLGD